MPSLPVVGKAHEAGAGERPFQWFIYGSSLDREAFAAWCAQHGYVLPDFARAMAVRLDGYRLAFDVQSRFWGGAVASLRAAAGEHVQGLALPMSASARGLVDHKEGAISGLYEPFLVRVQPLAGGEPFDAVAYRAARPQSTEQPPSPSFLRTLIAGARSCGLGADYVAFLERLSR
jgi:hypothetical protein